MEIVRSLWSRPDFFLWVAIAATAAPAKNAASGRRTEYRTSTTAEQPLHHLNPHPPTRILRRKSHPWPWTSSARPQFHSSSKGVSSPGLNR